MRIPYKPPQKFLTKIGGSTPNRVLGRIANQKKIETSKNLKFSLFQSEIYKKEQKCLYLVGNQAQVNFEPDRIPEL